MNYEKKLAEIIEKKTISKEDLAKELNITKEELDEIESGENTPSQEQIEMPSQEATRIKTF